MPGGSRQHVHLAWVCLSSTPVTHTSRPVSSSSSFSFLLFQWYFCHFSAKFLCVCDVLSPCSFPFSVAYASEMCDVLNQDLFSACHEYLSPTSFHQQCRSDTCKCGTPCLCSALAHYAHHCRRFSVIIDFRSQISDCGEYSAYFWFTPHCYLCMKYIW